MIKKLAGISALATLSALATGALAADWSLSGFVRQEMAVNTNNEGNMNNQQSNHWNGVTLPNTGLAGAVIPTLTRPASKIQNNDFNQFLTRLEVNVDGKLTEDWSAHIKVRGINDEIGQVEKAFKDKNSYQQEFYNHHQGTLLEGARKDGTIDLPNAYLDYNKGPLWLRFGNQQIAWGEALFFRVSDVVNGLDLRRHLTLGVAAEEYADSRVPGIGLRGSYRMNESWDIEGFTQKFQPSILPGKNSPYNLIPSQFTVVEKAGFEDVKDQWNFGTKIRGKIGDYGVQAFAVRRNNPDGVFKWTRAQGPGAIPGSTLEFGTGDGVYSAAEWMDTAAHSRLDGLSTAHINEAPFRDGVAAAGTLVVANACGANNSTFGNVSFNLAQAYCIYDSFFTPGAGFPGDLKGWIRRDYPRESVFGFGVNHIFEGQPDSLMDQLIGRFELSYTPNKKFTNINLSQTYLEHNETVFAFIFEKYHKFSSDFPATYFVTQWMHKSNSDIFGRALEGVNNTPGEHPKGQTGGSDYVALALQQPSPTLEWRFDFTALTDFHGGWLFQPGVKWKPNKEVQVDLYANVLKSYGEQTNKNFAQGLEYANELFVRATYSF